MNHVFPKRTIPPLIISVGLLNIYFIFFAHDYSFLYYVFWLGGFGIVFLRYNEKIAAYFQSLDMPNPTKFLLLGYGAVIVEETIVALVHAANEGFTLHAFLTRTYQFWAFNLFAFTGFILGWLVMLRRYTYRAIDLFLISGFWGLFSEHTLVYLFKTPMAALLLVLPTMSTYNLIIAPAIASLAPHTTKEQSLLKRYIFTLMIFLAFSIAPVIILGWLRSHFPLAFPPCEYIPCAALP